MPKFFVPFLFVMSNLCFAQTSTTSNESYASNFRKADDLGLGLKFGSLSGVTGKYWLSHTQAWDVGLAFNDNNTAINIDYLWHVRDYFADLTNNGKFERLVPYFGVGGITGLGARSQFFNTHDDNFGLAARFPLGLELLPKHVELGVFAELALDLGVAPTTYSFFTADIGARYYF